MRIALLITLFAGCTAEPVAIVIEDGPWRVESSTRNSQSEDWGAFSYAGRVFATAMRNTAAHEERFESLEGEFLSPTRRWRVTVSKWEGTAGIDCDAEKCTSTRVEHRGGRHVRPDTQPLVTDDPCRKPGKCKPVDGGYHVDGWYQIKASDGTSGYLHVDRRVSPWRERVYSDSDKGLSWPNDDDANDDTTANPNVTWEIEWASPPAIGSLTLETENTVSPGAAAG